MTRASPAKPKRPASRAKDDAPKIARAYARVSTAEQAEEGVSLAAQVREMEGYATFAKLEIAEVYVERGVSGGKSIDERPEGMRLLADLEPGEVVIVPKIDRLGRNLRDSLNAAALFSEMGVGLHIVELKGDVLSEGAAKLIFHILGAVAEDERDRIRGRIRAVKRDQKGRGIFLGGRRPFGYQVEEGDGERRLIPDPKEQAAIQDMIAWRERGRGYRQISRDLAARGLKLSHAGVKSVLVAQEAARIAAE